MGDTTVLLQGKRIYLRMMEEQDVPYKVQWINDPEVRRTLNFDYPLSEVSTRNWLQKVSADPTRKDFIICISDDDQPIGYCGFIDIDYRCSKAEIYGGLGEKDFWGQGYGQEFRGLQLDYGFQELGLNRIYAYNWVENKAMIAINKKYGFKVEGTLRDDVFSHGEYRDRVIMGILKEEYRNKSD